MIRKLRKTVCPFCYGLKTAKVKKGYNCLRCKTFFRRDNDTLNDRDALLRWYPEKEEWEL